MNKFKKIRERIYESMMNVILWTGMSMLLAFLILVILQLFRVFDISWWWVFSPFGVMFIVFGIIHGIDSILRHYEKD